MFGKRIALSLIAVIALTAGSVPAADDAPRWKASGPFYAVVTRATERTSSGPMGDSEEKMKTTLVYEVTQKERKGGGWEMAHTLKRADGAGTDAEAWKLTVGIPFTLEFDDKMNFVKVGGIDKIVAKHAEAEEDISDADKERLAVLLTDGILNDLGEVYFPLPAAKPVTVKRKATLAGLFDVESDRTFAAGKVEKDGVAFRFEGADRMKPAAPDDDAPFKVVKVDEKKPAKTTGTTWLDPALGRPVRVTKAWSFEVVVTVAAAGQEADVTMAEKTTVDVTYHVKMPRFDQ